MSEIKYVDLDALSHFKSKNDATYVAKDGTKVLSDNNYTDAEKTKLAGIDTGAEVNVIENVVVNGKTATITGKTASVTIDAGAIDIIKVNGTAQTITDRAVDITVPTKISDLTNDDNTVKDASYVHTDNNYTTIEKDKLAGIASGAQVNVIEELEINGVAATISGKKASVTIEAGAIDSISVNGTPQTIDANKNVDITVPTKVSDLTIDGNVVVDASYVHTDNNFTTTLKNKLDGIDEGAEVNVIEEIQVNGVAQSITSKSVNISVPTNNNQLTNGAGYQTASDVSSAIDAKISSTYKAAGSKNMEDVPQPSAAFEGYVYNIKNEFTTTAEFVEGAGITYPAGTNVVIIKQNTVYRYDVLAGFVDLSSYVQNSDLVAITNAEIDALFE